MSYDMIFMVPLSLPRKRTERLGTFTAPSGSACSYSQAYRAAPHRKVAERLGTQLQPSTISTPYRLYQPSPILFHEAKKYKND